ncbi:hypothetical protein HHL22_18125 [Hymenobacter sp. RP-2-7]|uniref:SGNH hydrolase-type esterase domain-containing protein n=1 Tax=Hymenobacter polaris TaxID=2682546 RepID=A0A7Y0FP04_9BACT|nr:GDSL-type esterase/lipase family protein [Hymenobacter polaris]NML67126.1 hypothetical protein [Hymenobacter polaris]
MKKSLAITNQEYTKAQRFAYRVLRQLPALLVVAFTVRAQLPAASPRAVAPAPAAPAVASAKVNSFSSTAPVATAGATLGTTPLDTNTPGYNPPAAKTSVDGKLLVYCLGDSRTAGPYQVSPWPQSSQALLNQGMGKGHYVVTNAGVSGRMTGYDLAVNGATVTGALSAVDATMGDKAQKNTYYRSIVVYQHGVNDPGTDPQHATYPTSLANVRQAVAKIVADGFDGVFLVNEPQSYVRTNHPEFFGGYNSGLDDMVGTVPGVLGVIDLNTLASIQNMSDRNVSGDGLHFTDAANANLIAPFVAGYVNKYAASVGIPTSAQALPLPVELVAFTAQEAGPAAVRLAWTTASEQHADHFEAERSVDGIAFIRIGAAAAAGSSSSTRNYSLLDASLPVGSGQLYYRLRQVDADGSFRYSPVRTVTSVSQTGAMLMDLYPNPTRAQTTLIGALPGQPVQVLDALGRPVATALADATGTASLVLPATLPTGVYAVRAGTRALRLTVE